MRILVIEDDPLVAEVVVTGLRDAGFVVDVPATEADARRLAGGDLRMGLRGRLAADCLSDSTTFWK